MSAFFKLSFFSLTDKIFVKNVKKDIEIVIEKEDGSNLKNIFDEIKDDDKDI